MTSFDVHHFLDSFINFEIQSKADAGTFFQLKRIEEFCARLGDPQKKFTCIHVAGSKGKGTTCAFVAHILEKAGYKVGLYTSPHLKDVNERIRIFGRPDTRQRTNDIFPNSISREDLGHLINKYRHVFETFRKESPQKALTYFEALTALAFLYFKQEAVDFAVLETGLGGRLDATNVVAPFVCGLTPISMEHTAVLGDTIAKIAFEKASIIKPNTPVVVAPQPKEAQIVIEGKARTLNAKLYCLGKDILFECGPTSPLAQEFSVHGLNAQYRLQSRLLGRHQVANAALAIGLVECLSQKECYIAPQAIEEGIKETFWPCRFEVVTKEPWIVLDAAHTPDSMRSLHQTVRQIFPDSKVIVILGTSSDKDINGICQAVKDMAADIIFSRAHHPRAYFFEDTIKGMFKDIPVEDIPEVSQAIDKVLTRAQKNDVILIAGSVFLAAEARDIIKQKF